MAHSLETRVPFLDNDLVDFAMKLPVNMKLGNLDRSDWMKIFLAKRQGVTLIKQMMVNYCCARA